MLELHHSTHCPPSGSHLLRQSFTRTGWQSSPSGAGWDGLSGQGRPPTPPSSGSDRSRPTLPIPTGLPARDATMNGTYGHAQELNTHRNTGYSYPSSSTASSGLPHSTKSQGPTSTQPSRVASPVFNNPSRRGSANDAIHPYLQLPESISGSALGSLTEYTAQVDWLQPAMVGSVTNIGTGHVRVLV